MEGRGDRQQHGALGALRLGDRRSPARPPPCGRRPPPGPPPLSFADLADLAAVAASAATASAGVEIEAEQRRHRAHPDRHRLLHGIAAHAQQPRRVGDREAAGRRERRIFAERMAGDEGRIALQVETRLGLEHADRGEADRHQRRLGIARQRQLVLRPSKMIAESFSPERLVDLLENRARRGKRIGQRLAHADGLAPLAGKDERGRHEMSDRPSRKAGGHSHRAAGKSRWAAAPGAGRRPRRDGQITKKSAVVSFEVLRQRRDDFTAPSPSRCRPRRRRARRLPCRRGCGRPVIGRLADEEGVRRRA